MAKLHRTERFIVKRHRTLEFCNLFLPAIALLACTGTAAAAEPPADAPAGLAEAITLKPASFAPAVLMPGAQVPPAPAPLGAEARAAAIAELGLAAVEGSAESPPGQPVRLTPAEPWREDVGYLVISDAGTVHPESSIELPAGPPAQAALRLKVEQGGAWLVEFLVHGAGPGSYELGADSVRRVVEDPSGRLEHVVTALNAEADGWVTLRLARRGAGFHLYAVEFTRLR